VDQGFRWIQLRVRCLYPYLIVDLMLKVYGATPQQASD
jgi:hypothetical protein